MPPTSWPTRWPERPTPSTALLEEIWTPALERAKERAGRDGGAVPEGCSPRETFASWDWWYYAEKVRKQKYALDEEMLRPYFSLENVQGGIFFLANRLYGITFQPDRRAAVPSRGDRLRGARRRPVASGRALFRLLPARRQEPGRVVRQLRGADLPRTAKRVAPVVSHRLQLHPPGAQHPCAADPRRDRNAVPRIRACAPFPVPRREVPRTRGGRGRFRGAALADRWRTGLSIPRC